MEKIGRYRVIGELGRGAMGIVYEAEDPLIGRNVAIKTINLPAIAEPVEAEFLRERLFREARSAGALSHPGIVTIFDVGQQDSVAFIAMEKVVGPSLYQVLNSTRKLSRAEAIDILKQTAAALDCAHEHGVIHRDIKPANIMLQKGSIVKVADFGIAKITSAQNKTRTGMMMGTPAYMAPEQINSAQVDGRADQFSLAVVAYEMLTGSKPFQADSLATLVHMIVFRDRPSARATNPSLPAAVDDVFRRGLAVIADQRYASCTEFINALDAAVMATPLPAQVLIQPTPTVPPAENSAPIHKGILAGGIAVLALIAMSLLWFQFGPALQQFLGTPAAKPPAPTIAQFIVEYSGKSATLRWDVGGATTEVSISPAVGKVQPNGTVNVTPASPTTYVLTATGPGGVSTSQVAVDMTAAKAPVQPERHAIPRIVTFHTEPKSVKRGSEFRLVWKVAETSTVSIEPGIGTVDNEGSRNQTLTSDSATYILTAKNGGATVKKEITVSTAKETPKAKPTKKK